MAAPRSHWLTRLLGAGSAPASITRPDGPPLIWLHIGDAAAIQPTRRILRRLIHQPVPPELLLSHAPGVTWTAAPDDPLAAATPLVPDEDMQHAGWAETALRQRRPDLGVLIGAHPDMALALAARAAAVPLLAAEARFEAPQGLVWPWQRVSQRERLAGFRRILLADRLSARVLRRLDLPPTLYDITGPISDVTDPLPCAEAERTALAQIMAGRPAWVAVEVPAAEADAVIAAQNEALRLAHRLLLILMPTEDSDVAALTAHIEAAGLSVARRDLDEDPEEEVQVLLIADRSELGLWYRLAPITWMGGTLTPGAKGRSPMEPAAPGSSIIHGPSTGSAAEAEDYRRLDTGRATRRIATAAELPEALADLMSPDRAAELAHAAWGVTSGGAAVADTVAQSILRELQDCLSERQKDRR